MAEEEWDFVDGLKSTRSSRLYDVPALLLCLLPALPHPVDLWSSTSPGPTRRAPNEEVPPLDGPQEVRWVGVLSWLDERGMVDRRR